MNFAAVQPIADAVLYEGYLLYPYRQSSVKNQTRWTFGRLFPQTCSLVQRGAEACSMHAECLLLGDETTVLEGKVRFLHLVERHETQDFTDGELRQEAVTREENIKAVELRELLAGSVARLFTFPACEETIDGVARRQKGVTGEVRMSAVPVAQRAFRVTIEIANRTPQELASPDSGDDPLLESLVSTHALLGLRQGEFVSLVDPPEALLDAATACRQTGVWPVMVGDAEKRDTLLVSPIILEDFPRIAAESAGDLFDATEIDEILTLRILTLTDDERRAMCTADDRARRLLERSESLTPEQLLALHGRMTAGSVGKPIPGGFQPGNRVRLRPRDGADAFDMILRGKSATIQSVEQDFEGQVYLCVTIDDDPGRDLGAMGQPGHRFFYRPEEVDHLENDREQPQ